MDYSEKLKLEDKLDNIISQYLTDKNTPIILKTVTLPNYKIILDSGFVNSLPNMVKEEVLKLLKEVNR